MVPPYTLTSSQGEEFSFHDFHGKALILTFIFTRCPVVNFCPRMTDNFRQVQQLAIHRADLHDRLHLLSITLDPDHDTPEVLSDYAEFFVPDSSRWTLATGSRDQIAHLQARFGVTSTINPETGVIDHTLSTALVAPDGKLVKIWYGNRWTPESAIAAAADTLGL